MTWDRAQSLDKSLHIYLLYHLPKKSSVVSIHRDTYFQLRPSNRNWNDLVPGLPGFKNVEIGGAEDKANKERGRKVQEALAKDLKEDLETETDPYARDVMKKQIEKYERAKEIERELEPRENPSAPAPAPAPAAPSSKPASKGADTNKSSQGGVDEYSDGASGGVDEYE